jgi:hypothetical protein
LAAILVLLITPAFHAWRQRQNRTAFVHAKAIESTL